MKINSKSLALNYVSLVIFGILMIYSATFKNLVGNDKLIFASFIAQAIVIFIFFIFSFIVINKKKVVLKYISKYVYVIFVLSLIFLFLVLTFLGSIAGGARSVFDVFLFTFQPFELFKIALIFYLAKYLANNSETNNLSFILNAIIIPFIGIFLVLLEPDLGGVIILILLLFLILIINGKKLKLIFQIFSITVISGTIGFFLLGLNYQISRIFNWLNPFADLSGDGNNLVQSYIAISNGGLTGEGYANSIQKSGYLFASSTDFIFAIIAEELGILGVMLVIFLLTFLSWQVFQIGRKMNNKFDYLVCSGISILILLQTFINIGGVTGIIPMTGVTLPFISQGTNSFIFLSFAILYVFILDLNYMEKKKKLKKQNKLKRADKVDKNNER